MKEKTKTKKVDYNIEYAHVYTDEFFGEDHKKSVKELNNVIEIIKNLKKSYTLVVLIDEYNPKKHRLNIKGFLNKLEALGRKPDFIGFESRLIPYGDSLLKEVNRKTRKEYENYVEKRGKVPCSFLIAIWDLKRLGLIKIKDKELVRLVKKNRPFVARKIITILPRKYREVEMKALKIIKSTKFKGCLKNILDIFFD